MSVGGKEIAKRSKKKKKNNMGNKDMMKENPLASLGFGIVAYIDILWTLICVFGLFTVMLWPTLSVFHAGTGYKDVNPAVIQYELGTLGNMGQSSVQCAAIPIEVGKLSLTCPFGSVGEVLDYGVNTSEADIANCANNDSINQCRPDSVAFNNFLTAIIGKESHLYDYGSVSSLYAGTPCNMNRTISRLFVQYTCI